MFLQSQFPQWIITIFAFFCLFQVRTWFEEVLETVKEKARNFLWRGTLFTILPNRSFIMDESLKAYGLDYKHLLN